MKFFTKVRYEPGRITHKMGNGEPEVWNVIVESGKLSIFWDKKTQNFHKLDFVPPELDLDPLKLGKPAQLTAERLKDIVSQLPPLVRNKKDGTLLALIPEGEFLAGGKEYNEEMSRSP